MGKNVPMCVAWRRVEIGLLKHWYLASSAVILVYVVLRLPVACTKKDLKDLIDLIDLKDLIDLIDLKDLKDR